MSTLETTVSMLQGLTDDQLICIQGFAQRLMFQQNTNNPYAPMTEEEMLSKLATSRKHASEGYIKPAEQSVADLRAKYGL